MNGASIPGRKILVPLFLVAAVIVIVPLFAGALWIRVLTSAAIYALVAASVGLLYSRLNMVSLAHIALAGCGGWAALRLAHWLHLPFEINLLFGGLCAGVIGMVLVFPALRMRGLYLALIALMMAAGFQVLVTRIQFPNGGPGFTGAAQQSTAFMARPWVAETDGAYFVYCVIAAFLAILLIRLHLLTRPGRAWAMIRRSEAVAMSAGVNVTFYKVWAFALSGFLAGIGGGLLAGSLQFLDARSFPSGESVMLFALTVVGGAWSWVGAVATGVLYRVVPAILNDLGVNGNVSFILFGAALLHSLIGAPEGIAGQIMQLMRKLGLARSDAP